MSGTLAPAVHPSNRRPHSDRLPRSWHVDGDRDAEPPSVTATRQCRKETTALRGALDDATALNLDDAILALPAPAEVTSPTTHPHRCDAAT